MEKEKVSPDSSTHIAAKRKKLKKRKEKDDYREHKKGKKLKVSRRSSSECDSSSKRNSKKRREKRKSSKIPVNDDGCINLGIEPLSNYVDDREELHRQLFTIISKKELKKMLPSLLKKFDVKEIKKLCYEQLEILSKRRLQHILAGEEMASSSSSSSLEEEEDDDDEGETDDEASRKQTDLCSKLQVAHQKVTNRELEQQEEVYALKSRRSGAEDADLNIFQEMIIAPNQEEIDELVEGNVVYKTNATNEGIFNEREQQTSGEDGRDVEDAGGEVDATGEKDAGGEEDADAYEEAELRMLEFRARALKSLVLARERQMKQKIGQPK